MRRTFSPPPRCDDVERALADYARALGRFEPQVLRRTWESLAGSQQRGRWPSLALVVKRCESLSRPGATPPLPREARWQRQQRQAALYADGVMQGPLGEQARTEHWAGRLRSYLQITAWQQLCRGAAEPSVIVPDGQVAAWRLAWLAGVYDADNANTARWEA